MFNQIKLPKTAEGLFFLVKRSPEKDESAFLDSYAQLFILGAAYGFEKKKFDVQVTPTSKIEPIKATFFGESKVLLKAICLAEDESHEVLANSERMIEILMGYASGGFREIKRLSDELPRGWAQVELWLQELQVGDKA
jgi:hypothetical protein